MKSDLKENKQKVYGHALEMAVQWKLLEKLLRLTYILESKM